MTEAARIRIVSGWLLCAAVTVLWLLGWLPTHGDAVWLSLVPLALAMPPLFATCTPIFTDDYSADNLATDYDTRSGSWAVSGGVLTCTSASGLVVFNDASPPALGVFLSADITCATTSDKARLILQWVDDSNYWFAEWTPGASDGTMDIWQRSGGSNTKRSHTLTVPGFQATETLSVSLCWAPATSGANQTITAQAGGHRTTYHAGVSLGASDVYAGLGTGSGSSSVTFDNVQFKPHEADEAGCESCEPVCFGRYNIGRDWQLVFTGFASGVCSSGQCTALNATWIMPWLYSQDSIGTTDPTSCRFARELDTSGLGCDQHIIDLQVEVSGGNYRLRVTLNKGSIPGESVRWTYDLGPTSNGEPDLSGINDVAMNLLSNTLTGCDASAAACRATLLPP